MGHLSAGRKVTLWTKETAWVRPRRATAAQLVDSGAPGLESDMAGPGLRRTRDHKIKSVYILKKDTDHVAV